MSYSYNYSKYPQDVADLFKPGPPLQYKKPTDYYKSSKNFTDLKLSPLSKLLKKGKESNNSILDNYLNQFPTGTENLHLKPIQKIKNDNIKKFNEIEYSLQLWDPNNDPNIKNTDPFKTIFIGRLPYDITEIELQKTFSKFGEIEKIRIVKDKITKKSKGYAFILFTDPNSSKIAIREIGVHRGVEINGRICIVDIERGRTIKFFKPRRFGGGLGGRDSSRLSSDTNKDTRISHPTSNTTRHTIRNHQRPMMTAPSRSIPSRFNSNIEQRHHYNPKIGSRYATTTTSTTKVGQMGYSNNTSEDEQQRQEQTTPAVTSYRSRTTRTHNREKPEMPDY